MVRLPRIWGGSSSASNANYTSQCIHQTHVAHADTTTTMVSLATMPSAVTKIARNVHTILLIVTFLLSYPLSWCKQDTSTQTANWTSKHTYTSDLTPLHDRLIYRSTQTPPPTTAAPTIPSAQISPSQEPHHRQNITHLKTSSKPSLPMQITIFKWMNDANFLTRRHSCSLTINVTPVSYFLYQQ